MTETAEEGKRRGVHYLIPFLIPLCLALTGNADALLVSSTEWGGDRVHNLFLATLASWAAVSFLMWREYTNNAVSGGKVRFSLLCMFAFLTGALCALDASPGFAFFEALFGAAMIASCCIEAIGFSLTYVPVRIVWMAAGQAACIVTALMVSDIHVSTAGALSAFLLTLLLFVSGARRRSYQPGLVRDHRANCIAAISRDGAAPIALFAT